VARRLGEMESATRAVGTLTHCYSNVMIVPYLEGASRPESRFVARSLTFFLKVWGC
jgi:hypothetical protein